MCTLYGIRKDLIFAVVNRSISGKQDFVIKILKSLQMSLMNCWLPFSKMAISQIPVF